jgi:methylmalonyl-CoA mutase C-terminal domain/subunit
LREAGYEVIYLGLHNSPADVVKAAIEESADGIGVSYLSGQHLTQVRKLIAAMQAAKLSLPLFCGGVIPQEDVAELQRLGVARVIAPGTLTADLLRQVDEALQHPLPLN